MSYLSTVLLEACAEDQASVRVALDSGARRMELCERLDLGGITPSAALLDWTLERSHIPVWVMIRPRGGSYVHDEGDMRAMERDARDLVARGASGIVAGVLTPAGEVDQGAMRRLREAAAAPVTFHRAFDSCPDPLEALEVLAELGIERLLCSGGPGTAWEGRERLAELVSRSAGRLAIMPGGGIQSEQAVALVKATGAAELHVRANRAKAVVDALARAALLA